MRVFNLVCMHVIARVCVMMCVSVCDHVCVTVYVILEAADLPTTYTPTTTSHNIHANTSDPPTTPKHATPRLPTPPHNTTQLLHRAPQLIADNLIPCLCITSHNRTYNLFSDFMLPRLGGMVPLSSFVSRILTRQRGEHQWW